MVLRHRVRFGTKVPIARAVAEPTLVRMSWENCPQCGAVYDVSLTTHGREVRRGSDRSRSWVVTDRNWLVHRCEIAAEEPGDGAALEC
jgi:hypothetical protein